MSGGSGGPIILKHISSDPNLSISDSTAIDGIANDAIANRAGRLRRRDILKVIRILWRYLRP